MVNIIFNFDLQVVKEGENKPQHFPVELLRKVPCPRCFLKSDHAVASKSSVQSTFSCCPSLRVNPTMGNPPASIIYV